MALKSVIFFFPDFSEYQFFRALKRIESGIMNSPIPFMSLTLFIPLKNFFERIMDVKKRKGGLSNPDKQWNLHLNPLSFLVK